MDEKQFHDYLSSFTDADKMLSAPVRDTIRINTLKISKARFAEITKISLEPTFYEYGLYAESEARLGATWEYFLGYMHTQSLSSMLPSLILNPAQSDLVLDIAASPGSKTSHLAMLMHNRGAILANEVNWERGSALFSNIARLGVLNTKVTVRDGTRLGINTYFTKALVDAPCSSLSQPYAYKKFTSDLAYEMSKTQKKMLFSAYDSLQEGGELVYSTCTYAKEENEEVVKLLLEKRPEATLIDPGIEFPHDSGLSEFGKEFRKTARIYPHHFSSEGFFMAKVKKG
ncbi:MAG: RsmB/NOP family class I SAM-dependent RNA methyltransferase [Candidatus ainarchaeum sp.]|nr:RsmB/NOP family class I SAM-dependent RNA methyltransferase [Candidatus ainarchaeum sp.]